MDTRLFHAWLVGYNTPPTQFTWVPYSEWSFYSMSAFAGPCSYPVSTRELALNKRKSRRKGGGKMRDQGGTIWLTGLSGAGKTTIARLVEAELRRSAQKVEVLDGDVLRTNLCKDLGFSREDRERNIQRIGFVCQLLSRNGIVAIVAAISPYRDARKEVREKISRFIEVYCKCPLRVLIERDTKGFYRKALEGKILSFSGISDPYEEPLSPEVVLETDKETPECCAERVLEKMEQAGCLAFCRKRFRFRLIN